jgi:tRNA threonylcarbamoyladenosine dehydratase
MSEFSRFKKIITDPTFTKINNTTVLILGVGGVGSYAVESLARCGIGTLIIVDNDIVDITNINRQIPALHSTIGLKKVDVMKQRILDINPECKVLTIDKFIDINNIDILFKQNIDYVVDACDTISTKKLLILECIKRNIKFISSMGTGNKFDPTKLEIIDIRKTSYDPIARIIRKTVKDEHIKEKIMVVCSKEKPFNTKEYTPGSNSFVPSTAGLLCTSYIINDIKIIDNN